MSDAPRTVMRPNPRITPEQARDARARAWAYIYQCWHANKGGPHDLTNHPTKECTTRPGKKGRENADLHGD